MQASSPGGTESKGWGAPTCCHHASLDHTTTLSLHFFKTIARPQPELPISYSHLQIFQDRLTVIICFADKILREIMNLFQ